MPSAPYNPQDDAGLISSTGAVESRAFVAHYQAADPAVGAVAAVHAAAACAVTPQVVATGITNPDFPRVISATTAGTNTDVKAVSVIVVGTDAAGAALTETLPAFTVDTNETKTGTKAFKTVTQYTVPAMDGTGCTVSIGTGAALGLNHLLNRNTTITGCTYHSDTREATEPTVTTSATVLASNTIALNTALDGSQVDCYYLVEGDD